MNRVSRRLVRITVFGLLVLSIGAVPADAQEVIKLGDLVALKGVVKYPVRIKCAVLAWDALQEGISQYEKAH